MKQLILLAAVICFGAAILKGYIAWTRTSRAEPNKGYVPLTLEAAKARMEANPDAVLLDVRSQAEYDQEHLPGAVCLPNEDIQPDLPLPFEKDTELMVYCRSGRRSAEAAEKLAAMGYTNVFDLGGMQEQ